MRTTDEVRQNPERNAHLLCALAVHAFSTFVPRTKDRDFIKPRSAEAYTLAIICVFGRWGISLSTRKALKATMHHVCRLYMERHGQHSLAPRHAEPMKYTMVLEMDAIPNGTRVGKSAWDDKDSDVFNFRRLAESRDLADGNALVRNAASRCQIR